MHAAICDKCACLNTSTSAPRTRNSQRCLYPVTCGAASPAQAGQHEAGTATALSRRAVLSAALAIAAMPGTGLPAEAVQGYTAGRLPGMGDAHTMLCHTTVWEQSLTSPPVSGVSKATDADGYYTYTRPEGKQGGHGVGWSELPRYAFKVPPGWSEKAVSIADLGGTEVQQ